MCTRAATARLNKLLVCHNCKLCLRTHESFSCTWLKKRKKIVLRVKHARVLLVHHRKQTPGIDALSPSITPNRSIAVLTARRRQSSARLANQTCLGSKHSRVLLVKLHAARFFVTLHRRASVHKQWCSVLGDQSIPYHSRTASPLDSHRPDFAKQTSTKLRIH